jgi:hypothetical protein
MRGYRGEDTNLNCINKIIKVEQIVTDAMLDMNNEVNLLKIIQFLVPVDLVIDQQKSLSFFDY